jgi:hypothetical protein
MSDENTMFIVILALIVAVACGWTSGHAVGYKDGIAYQQEQPVNLSLTTYSGSDIVQIRYYPLSQRDWIGVSTQSDFVKVNHVTSYGMILAP